MVTVWFGFTLKFVIWIAYMPSAPAGPRLRRSPDGNGAERQHCMTSVMILRILVSSSFPGNARSRHRHLSFYAVIPYGRLTPG